MRILMTALHPVGGIRTFFRYIYGHPVFSDFSFTLVAPDDGLSEYLDEFLPLNRIRIVPAEPDNLRFMRQIRTVARKEPFKLIHSHGFSAGILTELSRFSLALPHLMTGQDVFMPGEFSGFSGWMRYRLMALLFRRMSGIHAVGEDARQNLLATFPGLLETRIHAIMNAVDTYAVRDSLPKSLKQQIGLADEVPLIGFFGRFMGQKGFRLLVDAIERIVKAQLLEKLPHVATFGWNGYIREDYTYLTNKGLGDYFHQLEQTHDIGSMLKAVDLVAMPSRWEACPLLAMEVLAAGVPIVGSDCIGLREVLADSPAKPFRTGNLNALTETIVNELKHLPERKAEFVEFQPRAVTSFGIEKTAIALAALYAKLAKVENF